MAVKGKGHGKWQRKGKEEAVRQGRETDEDDKCYGEMRCITKRVESRALLGIRVSRACKHIEANKAAKSGEIKASQAQAAARKADTAISPVRSGLIIGLGRDKSASLSH